MDVPGLAMPHSYHPPAASRVSRNVCHQQQVMPLPAWHFVSTNVLFAPEAVVPKIVISKIPISEPYDRTAAVQPLAI
jgi:hypothetical protein